jgi:hypothetical protein
VPNQLKCSGAGVRAADAFRHIGSLPEPIHRYPGRCWQSGAQQVAGLVEEAILASRSTLRSGRHRGLDDPILDDSTRPGLATTWALSCPTLACPTGTVRWICPGRSDVRTDLRSLQPRDLLTLLGICPLQRGRLFQQATRSIGCEGDRPFRSSVGSHIA